MFKTYLKEKDIPVCPKCNKKMVLDDVDVKFKGNQDEWWICESCYYSLIFKIRYGKIWKNEKVI